MKERLYDYFSHFEERHWWFQSRKDIVLRLLSAYHQKSEKVPEILDIGCGTGMMSKALGAFGHVTGLDNNEKAVEFSRKKVSKALVIQGSFPEQMPQATYDIISVLDVLEHIEKDKEAFTKLAQLLNPDGILVLTVPAYSFLWTAHDDINEHKRRYKLSDIRKMASNSGFEIQKLSYYNTILFIPIAIAKIVSRLTRSSKSHFGSAPPPAVINAPLRLLFSLEQYLLPYMNFPFGISIILVAKKS